jgi:hypothetical protein
LKNLFIYIKIVEEVVGKIKVSNINHKISLIMKKIIKIPSLIMHKIIANREFRKKVGLIRKVSRNVKNDEIIKFIFFFLYLIILIMC